MQLLILYTLLNICCIQIIYIYMFIVVDICIVSVLKYCMTNSISKNEYRIYIYIYIYIYKYIYYYTNEL